MTPKEKAQELLSKFKELPQEGTLMFYLAFEISKQCALIAVEEEIKSLMWLNLLCTSDNYMKEHINEKIAELQEIEQEIEKL